MAGFVNAHIDRHADSSYDVVPEHCPAADEHTAGPIRCYTVMFDGQRRACPYWYATTYIANSTERRDVVLLHSNMIALASNVRRCGVLCLRCRSNRPPGC